MKMTSKSSQHADRAAVADAKRTVSPPTELRRLERLFAEWEWPDQRTFVRTRRRAKARAMDVFDQPTDNGDTLRTALLIAAAELFGGLRKEIASSPKDARRLAEDVERVIGLSRIALARELLRAPELLTLLPADAVESQLATLTTFAPLRGASFWVLGNSEQIICMRHVGEGAPSRGARTLARQLLAGELPEPSPRGLLLALPVGRWQQPLAVLVGSCERGMRDSCRAYLSEAVPMLGSILERDSLLAGNVASERALVETSERKLTRLGFDLHDGPIQDVAVLAEDLRVFEAQLTKSLGTARQRKLAQGRFEDLDAQLTALNDGLRRISNEVHAASVLLNRPFTRALRDISQAFAARTNIEPRVRLHGDMSVISMSQQIALVNIIHEALSNIREHSEASDVEIALSVDAEGVELRVTDNGCGFELEPTLMRAARAGRLGLVAIHERARLLGGQGRIDSRPGGPTIVSVALERWEPLVNGGQIVRASA
jgi:signal transduction histidine kinase